MNKYRVRLLPSVRKDILDARKWYKAINTELPVRFSEQLEITIRNLKAAPFSHAVRYKNVRIANLRIFPYALHYFIETSDEVVVVIALHHTSINPDNWKTPTY